MPHVILLGDSILDNAAYVAGGPAVIDQVRARLPDGWRASLLAVDGSMVDGVHRQLDRLPRDATHLVLSAGGNDAIDRVEIVEEAVTSSAQTFERLAEVAAGFEARYRRLVERLVATGLPAAVSTIYFPRFEDARFQRLAVTGLTVFNDAILRVAFEAGLPLLDLRLICDEPEDYANPIEPSSAGGEKIAAVIAEVVTGHDFSLPRSVVYTR